MRGSSEESREELTGGGECERDERYQNKEAGGEHHGVARVRGEERVKGVKHRIVSGGATSQPKSGAPSVRKTRERRPETLLQRSRAHTGGRD